MPYARVLTPDSEGFYVAEILEFEGCLTEGETPAKALKNLESVARDWIETRLEEGLFIPEPFANSEMSGRFALRMPQSLHTKAAILAERDGVSLNTFIVSALAVSVGALDLLDRMIERFAANRPQVITQNIYNFNSLQIDSTKGYLPPPSGMLYLADAHTIG
jgi:predicted RNase H-like HicB family nuclease